MRYGRAGVVNSALPRGGLPIFCEDFRLSLLDFPHKSDVNQRPQGECITTHNSLAEF